MVEEVRLTERGMVLIICSGCACAKLFVERDGVCSKSEEVTIGCYRFVSGFNAACVALLPRLGTC